MSTTNNVIDLDAWLGRKTKPAVDDQGNPVVVEREMHRVTVQGDLPVGIDGAPSRELDGSAFA